MASPCRVLFIGIDAAEKDLLLEWAAEGSLPTLGSLLAGGAWGLTENPPGLYEGAVWPSFWTGLSPARHGRYCYSQIRTGTYECYPVRPSDTSGRAFWESFEERGLRVAIIDVPKSAPARLPRGLHVVDWGTHDPELGFSAWPESAEREIASRFGSHPVRQCDEYMSRSPEAFARLRDDLVRGVRQKAEVATSFLDRGGWDLFLTVFAESHCVGHQCWHVRDPRHPRHDPELSRSAGDPVKDVYVAIDAAIGRLLARVDGETTVFVLASHGMGRHSDATFLLDAILRRLESPRPGLASRRLARGAERAWAALPPALRRALGPVRTGVKRSLGDAASQPDLATRRCFPVPNNDAYGGIRINLVGREPHGLVRPGPEREAFEAQLASDLLAFVNLDSGRPLVRRVLRTADLYERGERFDDLPDLLVEWDRESPVSRIHSPRTGLIQGSAPIGRTGAHKPEGLFIAVGSRIPRGRVAQPVSITQVGPTLAAFLGVSLPGADGVPIEEIVPGSGGR